MKKRPAIALLALHLALSIGVVACHVPARQEVVVAQVPSITGQVTDLLSSRSVQALIADVANGATVSLIDTSTGQTVATTVTTATGGFTLSFGSDFKPVTGKPYYMEAVKGLPVGGSPNRAGAAIARVRTILFYNWNGWSSLSGGVGFPVSIGKATTTVAAIVGLKGLSTASQSALVGTISGITFTDPSHTIPALDYSTVFNLVDAAVGADQDPLEALAFDSTGATPATQYVLKAGNLVIHDNYSVNGAPSPATASLTAPNNTITFYGQNFPSSASITIGPVPVATWSVNVARTQLTATLASSGYSGGLQISQGASTWTGPFVPVSGTVGMLAGSGYPSYADGKGNAAGFNTPFGMAVGADGNLYVTDHVNHRIRKVTSSGTVTTVAGSGIAGSVDGTGADAQFNYPVGVAIDANGNLYVTDYLGHRIRKVTPSGVVTTVAGSGVADSVDGIGTNAQFNYPSSLAIDVSGNLYVVDRYSHRIRKVTPAGVVTTLAGSTYGYADGTGTAAKFYYPHSLVIDASGILYVTESHNNRIRKVTAAGEVTTLAGSGIAGFADGPGAAAQFNYPVGLAMDASGNFYVADTYNYRIRKVTAAGVVSTVAGSGVKGVVNGTGLAAQFYHPVGLARDVNGNFYVTDNNCISMFTP